MTKNTILEGDVRDILFMRSNPIMVPVILLGGRAKFKLFPKESEQNDPDSGGDHNYCRNICLHGILK